MSILHKIPADFPETGTAVKPMNYLYIHICPDYHTIRAPCSFKAVKPQWISKYFYHNFADEKIKEWFEGLYPQNVLGDQLGTTEASTFKILS